MRHPAPPLALLALWLLAAAGPVTADVLPPPAPPRIALIIDDLGHALPAGLRSIALDGPVAVAILPHTPHGPTLARRAQAGGKEVLLHLPLQSGEQDDEDPGLIHLDMTRAGLARAVARNLEHVPGAIGVNTHRGSLITRHPGHMDWLMEALAAHGLHFFIDSYTTPESIALTIAREHGLPAARRDVFLDHVPDPERIHQEFERLKTIARQRGQALGIGHPYPATLDYLERALGELAADGFLLVPVSALTR